MNFLIETIDEKQKVLIVSDKKYPFITLLETEIKKYGAEIFFSSKAPKVISGFDYCFFINQKDSVYKAIKNHHDKIVIISYNQVKYRQIKIPTRLTHAKIIEIHGNNIRKEHIDTMFWFIFSQSNEHLLQLTVPNFIQPHKIILVPQWSLRPLLTKKNIIIGIILLFFFIHTVFIAPLLFSLFFTYRAVKSFQSDNVVQVKNSTAVATSALSVTKNLYALAQPTLSLFSIALLPDTLIDIDEKAIKILQQSLLLMDNIQQIRQLLFNKDKNPQEKAYLLLRLNQLKDQIQQIEDNATILVQKLPTQFSSVQTLQKKLSDSLEGMQKISKLLPYIDSILADNTEKKYLLFFANNMELRPGGGFLGSFGVLTIKDYTIENVEIHDVYDADGQLIAHFDPPEPIRKYLNIPHWFLRDSNFSPDFPEDYDKAKMFLEKEINLTGFSGSILITTSAIENVLDAFGPIYLPDFNETITQQNFYIKTQIHTEKDFFPGSIQKKSFLSSLADQILINLETASPKKLALAVKKSLDEKQIVIYFDDQKIQASIDSFYWSGRTLQPQCAFPTQKNCMVDYIFPYDANVGANKVNFFITRSMYLKTIISPQGQIQHIFSLQFRNDSPADVFPGGTYKNYFQIMLPLNTIIKNVTKEGVLVDDYTETDDRFKTIGVYLEIPPQKTSELKITYTLNVPIKNDVLYQLIVQKQIGSSNNDYVLDISLPNNISILNQNFTPLVKDNHIVYNTSLTADKIFFIELSKK